MARNTGSGHRIGSVKGRTQFTAPNGNAVKRDSATGRIVGQKTTPGPYKGVAREPDGRRSGSA